MKSLPMLVVCLSAGGFFLCFGGAALSTCRKNGNLGMRPIALLRHRALQLEPQRPLRHRFASPTLATWLQALLVRVVWQLGSGVLMAVAVFIEASANGSSAATRPGSRPRGENVGGGRGSPV